MKLRSEHVFSLTFGTVMLFWLCACSPFGGNTTLGSTSTVPTATPVKVLQNAANAMAQLKTVHLDMNVTTATKATGGTNTAASASSAISVKAEGDQIFPDQTSLHLTVDQMNGSKPVNASEIITNKKMYLQDAKGQWYATNMQQVTGNSLLVPQVSNYNNLLVLAQRASFTDHGNVALNGQTVRYISVVFDKSALKELMSATGQLGSLSADEQKNLDAYLQKVALDNSKLDLWINKSTNYVQRMDLKFSMSVNASDLVTSTTAKTAAAPQKVSSNVEAIIDYSNFNAPVTIKAPANALPSK